MHSSNNVMFHKHNFISRIQWANIQVGIGKFCLLNNLAKFQPMRNNKKAQLFRHVWQLTIYQGEFTRLMTCILLFFCSLFTSFSFVVTFVRLVSNFTILIMIKVPEDRKSNS